MPEIKVPIPFTKMSIVLKAHLNDVLHDPQPVQEQHHHVTRDYNKVFVIGDNKTGTTSMMYLLQEWGFSIGNQPVAELLSIQWLRSRETSDIIRYCHTADAFQDVPFSLPELYKTLDEEFPNSKFILTVRNNEQDWFSSLTRFHTKLFSSDKSRPPTAEDLQKSTYRLKGYGYEFQRLRYDVKDDIDLYNPDIYIAEHCKTNLDKKEYFSGRVKDFIEINLNNPKDFRRLCDFLGVQTSMTTFPHENKS